MGGAQRRQACLGVVIALTLAGGVLASLTVGSSDSTPLTAAAGYVRAVMHDDSRRALSFLNDAPAPDAGALLTDESLRRSNMWVGKPSFKAGSAGPDAAVVSVEVRTIRGPLAMTITLTKTAGKWKVSNGLDQLTFDLPPYSTAQVNGLSLPHAAAGSQSVSVFPGIYRVQVSGNPLFSKQDETIVATGKGGVTLLLHPSAPSSGLERRLKAAVVAALGACAISPDVAPAHCPFSLEKELVSGLARGSQATYEVQRAVPDPTLADSIRFDEPTVSQDLLTGTYYFVACGSDVCVYDKKLGYYASGFVSLDRDGTVHVRFE